MLGEVMVLIFEILNETVEVMTYGDDDIQEGNTSFCDDDIRISKATHHFKNTFIFME